MTAKQHKLISTSLYKAIYMDALTMTIMRKSSIVTVNSFHHVS